MVEKLTMWTMMCQVTHGVLNDLNIRPALGSFLDNVGGTS